MCVWNMVEEKNNLVSFHIFFFLITIRITFQFNKNESNQTKNRLKSGRIAHLPTKRFSEIDSAHTHTHISHWQNIKNPFLNIKHRGNSWTKWRKKNLISGEACMYGLTITILLIWWCSDTLYDYSTQFLTECILNEPVKKTQLELKDPIKCFYAQYNSIQTVPSFELPVLKVFFFHYFWYVVPF